MRFAGTELSNYMGTQDYSGIAGASQKGRSMERRATMEGEAMVANAGVDSLAKMKSAEFGAEAIAAEGAAAGQSAMFSGLSQGISGLASGFGSMGGGGGITSYDQIPSEGLRGAAAGGGSKAYFGTGGKYGSFNRASAQQAHNNFRLDLGLGR